MNNISVLSVNGQLQPMWKPVAVKEHDNRYKPVQLQKPLLVEYLRFRICHPDKPHTKQSIAVSSLLQVNGQDTQKIDKVVYAAEKVSFYDDQKSREHPFDLEVIGAMNGDGGDERGRR